MSRAGAPHAPGHRDYFGLRPELPIHRRHNCPDLRRGQAFEVNPPRRLHSRSADVQTISRQVRHAPLVRMMPSPNRYDTRHSFIIGEIDLRPISNSSSRAFLPAQYPKQHGSSSSKPRYIDNLHDVLLLDEDGYQYWPTFSAQHSSR